MTTITIDRATAQQALEALGLAKLNGKAGLHPAEIGEIADAITALRAALAQQAETEEPVAWRVQRSDGQYELYFVKASAERAAECYIKRPQVEPLYTAPPQRKPLTEEEINRIDACIDESTPLKEGKRLFARAIENASWEKNHGQT